MMLLHEIPETWESRLLRLSVDRDGLIEWDMVAARMDQEGTPHPFPGALTP